MTYDEALSYMSGLVTFNARKDRERFSALLERLGAPHTRLRCLHVAGTNGKGSTSTFIASILRAAGYRVGLYLSPFVFDLGERWQVDGAPMDRATLTRQVEEIRPHVDALAETDLGWTTEFELKTAIAFRWFVEREVDFAVIEVGIGGARDSTNIIPPPLVAAITSIGLDHVPLLGDTLAAIATEKAGILKSGTAACVTPVDEPSARAAIEAKAALVGVPVVTPPPLPATQRLGLRGPYQRTNAAVAAQVCRTLRDAWEVALPESAIDDGLASAFLPGRFQVIEIDGKTLVLDVAHNDDGAAALANALAEEFPGRRATFVVGATRNHEPVPLIERLIPLAKAFVATEPGFRPLSVDETAQTVRDLGWPVRAITPASRAIAETVARAAPGDLIVATGSFYVVCETPEALRGG